MNHLLFYVKENQISPTYFSLNFFIFLSLQFSNIKTKSSFFSQGLRGTQSWNLVHTWTLGWCIMYTWIGLLVFIYSFISSVFFISNSKILIFLSHFSVRPTKLKLDTHMGKGLIYCVHQIQAARIYLFLYFSSFFCLSNWQRLKTRIYKIVSTYLWWLRPGVCELCSLSAIFRYQYILISTPSASFKFFFLSFIFSIVWNTFTRDSLLQCTLRSHGCWNSYGVSAHPVQNI